MNDTDPMGMPTCWVYDNEGRQVKQQINCQGSSSSSSSSSSGFPASCDTDVTTLTGYNADSNVSTTTAMNLEQGQVTTDGYVTAVTNAAVASSQLLSSVTYPDSTTKPDQVSYKYNRLGQVVWKTDQSGTQHYYTYDGLGRLRQDCVFLAVGSPVDNAVLRIETSYEVRGMVSGITSYDNPKPGSGNVVNDVQRVYNGFGQLVAEYQSHDGEVDFEETPSVEYVYADGSANTIRPTSVTYPDGRVLNYDYGTAGQMNDLLSRIASLIDSDGISHLGDYSYLGLGTIILVSSVQPNIQFNLVGFGGGTDPVTGDIYQGLDSFGRVKDLIWNLIGTTTTLEEIQHGYDLVGNRIWRAEPVDASDTHDEFYTYDAIHRLQNLSRGSLNSGKTGINGQTFGQSWALDDVGNWSRFMQNDAGTITSQTRTSNLANEILSITAISGPAWATPLYDFNGNMTSMPQPANPGQSYAGVYDAWNRLVKLQEGGSVVGQYAYDGLNRRTTKTTFSSGTTNRDYYYSNNWQVLEERVLSSSSSSSSSGPEPQSQPDRQFVWGLRYIDDLLLRDRAPSGSGPLSERFYGIQDPNWNLTAICNSSGLVQERYDYDAYGVPTVLSASFVPLLESAYNWETLFAGYRWDDESGLYQVRNRQYHSVLASWMERDPIGMVFGGTNLYQYVKNIPVVSCDPLGLNPALLAAPWALEGLGAGLLWLGAGIAGLLTAAAAHDAMVRMPGEDLLARPQYRRGGDLADLGPAPQSAPSVAGRQTGPWIDGYVPNPSFRRSTQSPDDTLMRAFRRLDEVFRLPTRGGTMGDIDELIRLPTGRGSVGEISALMSMAVRLSAAERAVFAAAEIANAANNLTLCDHYYLWCLWGKVCGYISPRRDRDRDWFSRDRRSNCESCWESCKTSGQWDFEACHLPIAQVRFHPNRRNTLPFVTGGVSSLSWDC